jgi:pimeloyl-ACP methyl ester carboxylesterase
MGRPLVARSARERTAVVGKRPLSAFRERQIALKRGPLLTVLEGGEGPPLVWLHGPRRPDAEDPVLAAVAARFTVTAPLFPGQASLDELEDLPTLHDLALFYDGALAAAGIERAILVGHSFGGMLAAELAALAPQRASGLVLISPLGLWNDAHPVADLFARPYPAVDELIWSGAEHRPPPAGPADDPIEAYIALANALGGIAKYTWPIPDRGLRGRLYRIAAPTLLLFAKDDAFVPVAYAEDFAAELEDVRKRELPGSHMAPYEDPAVLGALIEAFAAGLG